MVFEFELEPKLKQIVKNTLEIITLEELKNVLKKKHKVAYIGFEPSGKIHLGHYLQIKKMVDLEQAGFDIIVLLADLHAYLNGKGNGDFNVIHEYAKYNEKVIKKVIRKLGLENAQFIYGCSFQLDPDYTHDLLELATKTTVRRATRSMELITREMTNPKVAQLLYPLMQVNDIKHLEVDVAVGGMEQRKIHMLARELLDCPPVCIHNPILTSLDGKGKMSSSKGENSYIAVDDDPETIRRKIMKAYCPIGVVENNPILEIAKYFVQYPLEVGNATVSSYNELEQLYRDKKVHPLDLKEVVWCALINLNI